MSEILTYDEIVNEINNNRLITGGDVRFVEACSYDMRVGTIFREGPPIKGQQGQAILHPGDIVSLFTLEELSLTRGCGGYSICDQCDEFSRDTSIESRSHRSRILRPTDCEGDKSGGNDEAYRLGRKDFYCRIRTPNKRDKQTVSRPSGKQRRTRKQV